MQKLCRGTFWAPYPSRGPEKKCRSDMKLITHNMLSCHIKGVRNGFPFKIEAEQVHCIHNLTLPSWPPPLTSNIHCMQVETCDADFDPAFLRHMFPKIEWDALVAGAAALGNHYSARQIWFPVSLSRASLELSGIYGHVQGLKIFLCLPQQRTWTTRSSCRCFTTPSWR